jgi:ribonucleoside-diphosphate reductase alpha chain
VSATVSINDDEWEIVGDWMWENRDSYNGLSCLPHFGGTYPQLPFESIDEATFEAMYKHLEEVDLTKVVEEVDNTDLAGEVACGAGGCSVV